MAKRFEKTTRYEASADTLLRVLTDSDFQVAREKSNGALECTVQTVPAASGTLVLKVGTVEYARGVTGIDRSKTERATSTYTWNLAAREASWTYVGAQGERARVWGKIRIVPAGATCSVSEEFNVEIKIPLLGGQIEKMVIAEVEKVWARYEGVVREAIARLS